MVLREKTTMEVRFRPHSKRRNEQNVLNQPKRTRSAAARFAVANTVIEGGYILPETEKLMKEWVAARSTTTS